MEPIWVTQSPADKRPSRPMISIPDIVLWRRLKSRKSADEDRRASAAIETYPVRKPQLGVRVAFRRRLEFETSMIIRSNHLPREWALALLSAFIRDNRRISTAIRDPPLAGERGRCSALKSQIW
jgi:hypothetical protein